VPFVAARDIAAVAFHLLTDEKSHDTDYPIRGPELLSYEEVRSPWTRSSVSCDTHRLFR